MRLREGFVKDGRARLRRVLVAARARGAARLAPALARGRRGGTAVRGRLARSKHLRRVLASERLGRVRQRLVREHVAGLLAGGGAAVLLAVLSSQVGGPEPSRAAPVNPVRVLLPATAGASPTRFAVARDVAPRRRPHRGGRAYYRKTTSRHVPAAAETGFLPLYREAARSFGVSWRLIASIHRQETAFSTVPGTYHGLNAFGCCAGPMQFNVTNGPVTTWELYRDSFRLGTRPHRYPHRTRTHPSVYDDFDAIMAAGALLRDAGASDLLDGGSWSAAYAYYGHDRFGVGYASQVVARAQGWELTGFCLNCPEDAALVAVLDDVYGVDARRQLRAAERLRKQKKHKRHKKESDGETSKQAGEQTGGREEPRLPASEREPVATPPAAAPAPDATTTPPPATTTEAPPPATAPVAPATKACTPVTRLLGCRP
jgi:hypothetical protein